jgi:hypothetical protein
MGAASVGGHLDVGSIELLFLLSPLVVVSLGLELSSRLETLSRPERLERWGRILQPFAAASAVASFWVSPGPAAATLATGWFLLCALLGLCGLLRVLRGGLATLNAACTAVAFLYLPIGAAWLVASRAGLTPLGFQEPIVLLTAVHSHYAGFAAPLLAQATGRALGDASWLMRAAFRPVAVGVLAGPGLLAAGFVAGPLIKLPAALLQAGSEIGLAICVLATLSRIKRHMARILLVFSCGSVLFAMALGAGWAIGEYPLQPFLNLSRMARLHGVANAFGFILCGQLGWLLVDGDRRQSP